MTINCAAPASSLSPSTPPPPPPPTVKVCACCVYCHDEVVVHQCSMLSAGPPHGTCTNNSWLTRLELYLCTDLLSCHSVFTTHFFPTLPALQHAMILQRAIIFLTSQQKKDVKAPDTRSLQLSSGYECPSLAPFKVYFTSVGFIPLETMILQVSHITLLTALARSINLATCKMLKGYRGCQNS